MSFDASNETGGASVETAAQGGASGVAGEKVRLLASAVASSSGALACAVPGAIIGDKITVVDMTGVLTSAQTATHFETTVSVTNQVQQTSAYPGGDICVLIMLVIS